MDTETRTIDGFTIRIRREATYHRPSSHQANADDVLNGTIVEINVPGHGDPFAEPSIGVHWQLVWDTDMPVRICGVATDQVDTAVDLVLNTGRAWRARRETLDARRARTIDALTRAGAAVSDSAPGTAELREAFAGLDRLLDVVLREGLVTDDEIAAAGGVTPATINRMRDPEQMEAQPFLALDDAQFARRIGVEVTTFRSYLSRGRVPAPDVTLGTGRGWRLDTIERWIASRPGRGSRTDMTVTGGGS